MEITLLFDYYGELLTKRQQEIVNLYYIHDLSLGEIAEKLEVSRQCVYDHLQRAEKALHDYENDLGLVKKFKQFREKLNDIDEIIKNSVLTDHNIRKKLIKKINEIKTQF